MELNAATDIEMSTIAARIGDEKEHKFRNTVMQAPVGIIILRGKDMIVEMANQTYLYIVDKTAEEFTGCSLFHSLPEVRDAVEPILLGILDTGVPFYGNEFEVTLNRFGKKEQTFFNFVYHPLKEDDDTISGIIVVATEVTTQVYAKRALEQREAQFRSMVSQSPIAMGIFRGPEHIIELANDTMLRTMWRKEFHEVEGKKLLDVFPELVDQPFPQQLQNVLTTGIPYRENEAVAVVDSSDGRKKFFLDFEYAPLLEADGTISGVMATVHDVTERVESRNKIELGQKRYKSLLETLPVAVFTINKDGFIDMYNQAATTLWARQPVAGVDKWCGSHGLFTLDGVRVPHEECPMALALKENRRIHTEAYVQRPDGAMRHVIAHPQPIHDTDGDVIGAMNVLIDITDRKETENALRGSEEKFRVLANSMPQFIWTALPDGSLNYFSQSVYDFSGFTEERLFKEGWLEIVHPDDREKNIELWLASIATGEAFHYEHRFRKYDGQYRWQLSRAVPQLDNDGNIQMWVGTSTDIHDRKLFSDELNTLVEERTRELNRSNEDLVRLNDELMQFNYVASHDLQEPLRKIQTFISRVLDMEQDNLSDKGKDFLERVQRSSARTQKLIQDLLSFSRTNTAEKFFESADLGHVLDKVKEDLHEQIIAKQVAITTGPLPVISGISFQLEQLFTNLITNAIKFARPGVPAHIAISSRVAAGATIPNAFADATKNYHHISFSDNGIGFDPEFSERIFVIFQRLHTSEIEGTGIGLSICKRIVENHNGFITATGELGVGAVFNIYLPA